VIERRRKKPSHAADASARKRRILLTIARGLLALGIAAAFLVEGIAGSRAAWIVGNVLAVILGVTWLIRRR
jgi:predicted lipid-binding transport protein (Tim44 family)